MISLLFVYFALAMRYSSPLCPFTHMLHLPFTGICQSTITLYLLSALKLTFTFSLMTVRPKNLRKECLWWTRLEELQPNAYVNRWLKQYIRLTLWFKAQTAPCCPWAMRIVKYQFTCERMIHRLYRSFDKHVAPAAVCLALLGGTWARFTCTGSFIEHEWVLCASNKMNLTTIWRVVGWTVDCCSFSV